MNGVNGSLIVKWCMGGHLLGQGGLFIRSFIIIILIPWISVMYKKLFQVCFIFEMLQWSWITLGWWWLERTKLPFNFNKNVNIWVGEGGGAKQWKQFNFFLSDYLLSAGN